MGVPSSTQSVMALVPLRYGGELGGDFFALFVFSPPGPTAVGGQVGFLRSY